MANVDIWFEVKIAQYLVELVRISMAKKIIQKSSRSCVTRQLFFQAHRSLRKFFRGLRRAWRCKIGLQLLS